MHNKRIIKSYPGYYMSFKITADSSPDATFIIPEGSSLTRSAEACRATELTSAVAMPAIAAAGLAIASAASSISPSCDEINAPLKFRLLSRKLLELGYCEFEEPHSLRYILTDILKQLEGVTKHAESKMQLKTFIEIIELPPNKRSLNDTLLAEAILRFITTPETKTHFDCSSIHYDQRELIKASFLKGAELLAQLSPYWDSLLEVTLKEHLPEEDSLKVVSHLLKDREMLTGYITNLGEKTAQKLSTFAARNSVKKQDYSIIAKLIFDVLIDKDTESDQSRLSPKHQGAIRTILEPYHASKKIKNGSNILGPSIDIYFYEGLINSSPMRVSHTEPQGHIPTLLHAFLYGCKQMNDQLDEFEIRVELNKKHIARTRAVTAVEEEGLTQLTGSALHSQFRKEVIKVDKLASGLNKIFQHMSLLKHLNKRLEEHITRNISISPSFIRTSRQLMNLAKDETIEIHNLLAIEVTRNLISQEALRDEDLLPQVPLRARTGSFSLLSTSLMDHGAAAPYRIPSIEQKMEYRRTILAGKEEVEIATLLESQDRNIKVLEAFQIMAESVIRMTKALDYLLGCELGKMEEDLAKDKADYEERFALLTEELELPDAKLPPLFTAAQRTFIPTPPRTSSATDRTITPSPPRISRSGAFSPPPTFRSHTPLDRLLAESPPPPACARTLSYEDLGSGVDPFRESDIDMSGPMGSITCQIKHMIMIRAPLSAKGSSLTEESTSHLVLAGQDLEQIMKAIQNRDLPLFRAAASLLMIDTHVAIEQHLKAKLAGRSTEIIDHSLVSLNAMLKGEIAPEYKQLLRESDLSIIWARYPERALETQVHKRRISPLIQCIELISSLEGFENQRDLTSVDTILSQLKRILTQTTALLLEDETALPLEDILAAAQARDMPLPPRKQNDLDRAIDAVEDTLTEICARSDLDPSCLTSLKEVTHYLNWIKAAENTLQSDSHKSSSYWIMRLFIGGVDKLFENLYIGAGAAQGHGAIRSHNLKSLRKKLFTESVKSSLSPEEIADIEGFNIGNGLQYPHQEKTARSAILLKALNYSLSHIGVEEGYTPARLDLISQWQNTLGSEVQKALLIWVKEARSLFPSECGAGVTASAAGSGSR